MPSRRNLRLLFAAVLVAALLAVGYTAVSAATRTTFESQLDGDVVREGAVVAPPSDGVTVIATDSNQWRSQSSDDVRATSELVAIDPDGTARYYDDDHDRYWDVDPVAGTPLTVEYAFSDHLEGGECPSSWDHDAHGVDRSTWDAYAAAHDTDTCTRNGVERVDLRTGEVTEVWTLTTPGQEATRYHDVDRLDDERLVVADIYFDRVFVVNTATDRIEWIWNAADDLPTDEAGPYPADWTHVNDVEVLDDGRIMVSLRNQDQVVFLDRERGLLEGWTLGAEDDHDVLFEQHNPDFIPADRGGPAVLVADSENDRIVEYQREGDGWTRTWLWHDARLLWPRDADRLPNGHTLVADSNGDRVFEVDRRGEVVWSVEVAFPYEVERLGTGDESAGGPSARQAGLASRSSPLADRFWIAVKELPPGRYLNGVMYATPVWMGIAEVVALSAGLVVAIAWAGFELRWARRPRRGREVDHETG